MSSVSAPLPELPFGEKFRRINADFEILATFQRKDIAYLESYERSVTRPAIIEEERFNLLVESLRRDTAIYSNPDRILKHPASGEIRFMGSPVLPYIFKKFDESPILWLTLLPSLVKESPVKERHRGRVHKMASDWKRWALKNGFSRP
jgi:hypothetical protein